MKTRVEDIIDSFESSFKDKVIIPRDLEIIWLEKAVGRFGVEISPLNYDFEKSIFNEKLDRYVIDTLAAFMKQSYQEREVSRVNKQVSIVGKDLSIDGAGHTKTAARAELEYCDYQSEQMIANLKPTAYD